MRKPLIIAAGLLATALAASVAAPAAAQSQRFPDVPPDHYAFEAVEWAAGASVTAGYTDGTFKPQRPLIKRHAVLFMERYYDEILGADESENFTRGDMMVLLKAINDGTLRGTEASDNSTPPAPAAAQSQRFPDVPPDHYAFEAVEWAAGASVTAGYTDGTFKPQRPLIKRHAVLFMERYYDEILGADESENFTRGDMMVLLKAINDGTLRGTERASMDLSGVCPSPLVVQTDWFPESEQGALFHLIGDDYAMDVSNQLVRGSMVLNGADLGIELEIRTGGPAIFFEAVPTRMHDDHSIHLGVVSTSDQMFDWDDSPVVSVLALLEKSPWMIMWDPQTYPDVHSIADLGREGVTVNVFGGEVFPRVLVARGVLSPEQVDPAYDGTTARFVSEGGAIAQQGFASVEPYTYGYVHHDWGRPVSFQLVHDAGFEVYSHTVAVRPADLESMRSCLDMVVPVIQQAVVSFAVSPDRASETIVSAVEEYADFWEYPPELAEWAAYALREYGLVGNGSDSTVGNLDADRIQRVLDALLLIDSFELADLVAEDLFTNDFIDESIGF